MPDNRKENGSTLGHTENVSLIHPHDRRDGSLQFHINGVDFRILTAKTPGMPWNNALHNSITSARGERYRESWGEILSEDPLDNFAYTYVAFATYPYVNSHSGHPISVTEGITMRMIDVDDPVFEVTSNLPDELKLHVGPSRTPIVNLVANSFYDGDLAKAREQVTVASRVAAIRPLAPLQEGVEVDLSNRHTAVLFSAVQVLASQEAEKRGKSLVINVMRPELDDKVLALPNGLSYKHTLSEHTLGLHEGSIKLDRESKDVQQTLLEYPGYFLSHFDIISILDEMVQEGLELPLEVEARLNGRALTALHPKDIKIFRSLLRKSDKNDEPTVFGRRILQEAGDAAHSYTMSTYARRQAAYSVINEASVIESVA